jgi:hypothetical protein
LAKAWVLAMATVSVWASVWASVLAWVSASG